MYANDPEIQLPPVETEPEPQRNPGKGGLYFALGFVLLLVAIVYLNMG